MVVIKASPGDFINIRTAKKDFQGTFLESYESDIVLLKLDSGYNIGIKKEDILNVKILKKKEKIEEKTKEIEGKFNQAEKSLPHISLIATGGTISSRLDYKTGGVKWLTTPRELLKFYPDLFEIVDVSSIEIPFMVASENMSSKEWQKIAEVACKKLNTSNISGVIITHGTDTLHYTSAALSFFLRNLNKPVVLTYSQRSTDRASSDANLNLICSGKATSSDIAEVMLVGHASISDNFCFAMPGTKVRKMHSSRRDTFKAINTKPFARIYKDKIEKISDYNIKDNGKKVLLDNKFNDKIALLKFYPGQKPDILDYYFSQGFKGIVVEATGLGHVATGEAKHNWLPTIKKVIKHGMTICFAPQTLYGRLDPFVYSPGRELQNVGVIYLEDMLPETAFVKLGWILGHQQWKDKIKEKMLTNFANEINPRLSEEFVKCE